MLRLPKKVFTACGQGDLLISLGTRHCREKARHGAHPGGPAEGSSRIGSTHWARQAGGSHGSVT